MYTDNADALLKQHHELAPWLASTAEYRTAQLHRNPMRPDVRALLPIAPVNTKKYRKVCETEQHRVCHTETYEHYSIQGNEQRTTTLNCYFGVQKGLDEQNTDERW